MFFHLLSSDVVYMPNPYSLTYVILIFNCLKIQII